MEQSIINVALYSRVEKEYVVDDIYVSHIRVFIKCLKHPTTEAITPETSVGIIYVF